MAGVARADHQIGVRPGLVIEKRIAADRDVRMLFGDLAELSTDVALAHVAAHAGCFTMALAFQLTGAGHPPEDLNTRADVSLEQEGAGWKIAAVGLTLKAKVPGLSKDEFMKLAEAAKANCPVSKVLNAKITLDATLE